VSKESNQKNRDKKKAAGISTHHIDMLGGKFGKKLLLIEAAKINKLMMEKIG